MMSNTHRAARREPAEQEFPYRARCCADAPHRTDAPHGHALEWKPVPPARQRGGYADLDSPRCHAEGAR